MQIPCLVGPTGVGKTDIALRLSEILNLAIISADSRQIYKYLDIGTAKPKEAIKKGYEIYLIDIIEPDKFYSAGAFRADCLKIIEELKEKNKRFIIVGGSGFYLRALFKPLFPSPKVDWKLRNQLQKTSLEELYLKLREVDPISAQKIHPNDRQRIMRALEVYELTKIPLSEHIRLSKEKSPLVPYYIGLTLERKLLYKKIEERLDNMIKLGLVAEVKRLLEMGYDEKCPGLNTIGYKEILAFLSGKIDFETAISLAKKNSKAYARRQLTWFKKEPISFWIENSEPEKTVRKILDLLESGAGFL